MPARPGSVVREAGANPARTRHCDRGSRSQAVLEPQPLAPQRGPGRRGSVGPGARRPPSDREADTPSRKGVAHLHEAPSSSPAWRPVSSLLARGAAAALRRRPSPSGSKGRRDTLLPTDRGDDDDRHVHQGRRRRRMRARAHSAGGALEPRHRRATGAARWSSFGDYQIQTIGARRTQRRATRRRATYWSFWLDYKYASTRRVRDADAGRRRRPVLRRAASACAKEPTPAADHARSRPRPAPGSRRSACAWSSTGDVRLGVQRDDRGGAGRGRDGERRRAQFTAGADGMAHVTVARRGVAGVRADEGRLRALGDRAACAWTAGTTPRRRRRAARRATRTAPAHDRSASRNGQVFSRSKAPRMLRGTVTPTRRGCGRSRSASRARRQDVLRTSPGGSEQFRKRDRAAAARSSRSATGRLVATCCRSGCARGRYVLDAYAIDGVVNRGADASA